MLQRLLTHLVIRALIPIIPHTSCVLEVTPGTRRVTHVRTRNLPPPPTHTEGELYFQESVPFL